MDLSQGLRRAYGRGKYPEQLHLKGVVYFRERENAHVSTDKAEKTSKQGCK
jgi:hypothetical protein